MNSGNNTISSSVAGLLYFSLHHSGTINVKVTSGGVKSPLFILGKHSQADWQNMLNNTTESSVCELLSNRTYTAVSRDSALKYLNGKDPTPLLKRYDQAVEIEDIATGLSPNAARPYNRPDPHRLAHIEDISNQYYMYAFYHVTGYGTNTIKTILDVDEFFNNG